MADNTIEETSSINLTPDEYRFIGTCEGTGQNMSAFVSNISFEQLAGLDHYIRSQETTSADSTLTYYGIGSNIANSLIVCAPTVTEKTMKDMTQVKTVRYYDNQEDGGTTYYDAGIDYVISPESVIAYATNGETSEYTVRDTGKYDLVASDSTGRVACLTPQFNDIDTRFFTTFMSTDDLDGANNSTYATYSDRITNNLTYGIGVTRILSLNESTANSMATMDKFMSGVGLSYTSILTQREKEDPLNSNPTTTNQNQVRIQKVKTNSGQSLWTAYTPTSAYVGKNGAITKIYNPQSPDNPITITKGLTSSYIVSFSTLLEDYINLKNAWDAQFGGNTSGKSIASRVSELELLVNKLNNLPYVFRGSTGQSGTYSEGAYLWAGTYTDFKTNVSDDIKLRGDYVFVLDGTDE